LFNDPYAEAFLMAAPGAFDVEQRAAEAEAGDMASWGAAFWSHAVIRTRFFDDYLLDATARGICQVVLLAAGLDTRAYRLRWPHGVRVYELDLPEVMGFKGKVLTERAAASRCDRTVVPIDLRKDWTVPLSKAGLSSSEPTAWLAEGLLIYLTERESADLLTRVGELSASRSRVAFEVENLGTDLMRTQARQTPAMQQYTKLWKGGLPDAPGWLAENGWEPQLHDRATVALSYGRPQAGPSIGGFVVAARA
jgi:methyltransferase (TIGR00027 family)